MQLLAPAPHLREADEPVVAGRGGFGVDQHDVPQRGQVVEHLFPPLQLVHAVQHHDRRRTVPGHVPDLVRAERGVRGARERAGVHGGEVHEQVFGAAGRHDQHAVAPAEPQVGEAAGEHGHLVPHLRPGQRRLAFGVERGQRGQVPVLAGVAAQ